MPLKYTERLFVHLLNQAGHAVSADFVQILSERGFTVRQWRVLGSLWDEESMTLTELAEATYCGHSTITRLIERLHSQGLVARRQDKVDRRRTHVSLTTKAREQIGDLVKISEDMEKTIIDTIGPDLVEKMKGELRQMISQLANNKQNGTSTTG